MKRLLIVDDDPDVLEALAFTLNHDFHVETARDGQQALDLLEEAAFDVVLLDYTMPRLDGGGLIAALRERQNEVPVLLSSALPELHQLAARIGVPTLSKPYDMDKLITALHSLASAPHDLPRAEGF